MRELKIPRGWKYLHRNMKPDDKWYNCPIIWEAWNHSVYVRKEDYKDAYALMKEKYDEKRGSLTKQKIEAAINKVAKKFRAEHLLEDESYELGALIRELEL